MSLDDTKIDMEWSVARVYSICRRVRPLVLGMPVASAVEAMRLSGLSELPVVSGNDIIGVVSLALLTESVANCADIEAIKSRPLAMLLEDARVWRNLHSGLYIASVDAPLTEIEAYLSSHPEVQIVPVTEPGVGYFGVMARFDVVAARLKTLAPSRVGGMATPLGVYLTDGVHRGGASDLGLVLSGATLGMLCLIANVIVSIATDLSERRLHLYPLRYLEQHSGSLGRSFVGDIGSLLILPVIMILLRILPLAGYHAAEHQVVHCIERGELLEPDNIRRMPRVHPRCGTNIAAAAAIFSLALCAGVIGWRTVIGAVAPAALLTFSFWRPLGSFLQQFFTTRPATDKQIRSGMRAARELLTQYRQDCNPPMTLRLRIWRTGLLQMLGGVIAITVLLTALSVFVPAVRPYIPSLF